jgi:hypothetical protein
LGNIQSSVGTFQYAALCNASFTAFR